MDTFKGRRTNYPSRVENKQSLSSRGIFFIQQSNPLKICPSALTMFRPERLFCLSHPRQVRSRAIRNSKTGRTTQHRGNKIPNLNQLEILNLGNPLYSIRPTSKDIRAHRFHKQIAQIGTLRPFVPIFVLRLKRFDCAKRLGRNDVDWCLRGAG
jgi:hypothetical protein